MHGCCGTFAIEHCCCPGTLRYGALGAVGHIAIHHSKEVMAPSACSFVPLALFLHCCGLQASTLARTSAHELLQQCDNGFMGQFPCKVGSVMVCF